MADADNAPSGSVDQSGERLSDMDEDQPDSQHASDPEDDLEDAIEVDSEGGIEVDSEDDQEEIEDHDDGDDATIHVQYPWLMTNVEKNTLEEMKDFLHRLRTDETTFLFQMSDCFVTLIEWIKFHSGSAEMGNVCSLFKLIDFTCVPAEVFVKGFQVLRDLCMDDAECAKFLLDVMLYYASRHAHPMIEPSWNHDDGQSDERLVIFGGMTMTDRRFQSKISCFSPTNKRFFKLTDIPEPSFGHGAAVLNNFLYVAGGCNYQTLDQPQIVREVYRYDVMKGKWFFVSPMLEKRCLFTLNASGGKLYAVGGRNARIWQTASSPDVLSASVECYDPWTDKWTYVAQAPMSLMLHASSVHGRKLYTSGGVHEITRNRLPLLFLRQSVQCIADMSCYDPGNDTWQSLTPLPHHRSGHAMVTIKDSIYVMAGRNTAGDVLESVECYKPDTDTWISRTSEMPAEILLSGSAVHEDKIYIFGGLKKQSFQGEGFFSANMEVRCYDPAENVWTEVAKMETLLTPSGCALKVPKSCLLTDVNKCASVTHAKLDSLIQWPPVPSMPLNQHAHDGDRDHEESEYDVRKLESFYAKVSAGLVGLHESSIDSDVVLVVDGERLPAHRAVLATFSDYFRAMFTGGMLESAHYEKQEVELQGVGVEGLKAVLRFIYTGQITLNRSTFGCVLTAASYLQVAAVLEFCSEFLKDELHQDNFLELVAMTTTYGLLEKFAASEKVIDHFVQMATESEQSSKFYSLTIDQVLFFLQSKLQKAYKPMQIFGIVQKWLEHNWDNIKPEDVKRLLNCVPFNLLSCEELIQHVRSADFMKSEHAQKLLLDALQYHTVPHYQHALLSTCQDALKTEEVILATGGMQLASSESATEIQNLSYFDSVTGQWYSLCEMPFERLAYGVTVMDNFVYIAGGENHNDSDMDPSGCQFTTAPVFRYDVRLDRWDSVASMSDPRTDFFLTSLGGLLYAVGGRNSHFMAGINSVECYNPLTDSWSYVAALQSSLFAMAGTTYGNKIYISGGCYIHTDLMYSNAVQCYDPATDQWTEKCAMSPVCPVSWHSMVTMDDKLYVVGGQQVPLETYESKCSYELKCYDPKSDRWSKCQDIPAEEGDDPKAIIAGYKSVAKDGKIYCFHGVLSEENFVVRKAIKCYDSKRDVWEDGPTMPRNGYQALIKVELPVYMLKQKRDEAQKGATAAQDLPVCDSVPVNSENTCEADLAVDADRTLVNTHHAEQLLQGLHELFSDGLLCDITMATASLSLPIHKILLTLLGDVENSHPSAKDSANENVAREARTELELYELPKPYLRAFIEMLYTGKVPSSFSASELLAAAEKLQLKAVLDTLMQDPHM